MGDDAAGPRILLLGATGFLGTHLDAALRADRRIGPVVGVARSVPSARRDHAGWRAVDLAGACSRRLDGLLADVRPDVVVNAAGRTAGDPEDLRALNADFPSRLVGAIHRRVPGARLVHLGSAAEYGPATPGRATAETDETRPVSPYGETKLAGTRVVGGASILGLDTVVLRVFNPLGAGMDARTLPGNAARRIATAQAAGDDVIHLGPLGAARDFVAAADVAAATVAAVLEPAARGQVLNVGTGVARPGRDLVARLVEVAGWDGRIEEADEGSARSGAVPWMAAAVTRAEQVLGWRAGVSFDDAVRALWAGARPPVTVGS